MEQQSRRWLLAAGAVVALAATAGHASALDRRVNIVNNTGYTIVEFYASSVGQNSWQEDILGRDVLPSGSSVTINIDDGTGYCKYDFRAKFEDGDIVEKQGVNVCEIGTFTYN
jgi:hypothetical protein